MANVWQEQTAMVSKGSTKEIEKKCSDLVVMRLIHQHPDRSFQTSLTVLCAMGKEVKY